MKKNIVILFLAFGVGLILIGYHKKKERITNFQGDHTNITIIDLSEEKKDFFTYYLISGITLISIGLIISIGSIKQLNSKSESTPFDRLTNQEKKVVHFIIEGKSNKEIANELSISLSTVKTHANNIYKKLGVNSRSQLLNSPNN